MYLDLSYNLSIKKHRKQFIIAFILPFYNFKMAEQREIIVFYQASGTQGISKPFYKVTS